MSRDALCPVLRPSVLPHFLFHLSRNWTTASTAEYWDAGTEGRVDVRRVPASHRPSTSEETYELPFAPPPLDGLLPGAPYWLRTRMVTAEGASDWLPPTRFRVA